MQKLSNWAEIDKNNVVIRVLVGDNNDPAGDEGYKWLIDNLGGTWIKTSYNTRNNVHLLGGTPFRGNYAAPGYIYDGAFSIFLPPKPYPSWKVDYTNATWVAPIEKPEDVEGFKWAWSEPNQEWVQVELK
jgi:hypothetical protein